MKEEQASPPPPRQQHERIMGLSETGIIWLCYVLHALSLFCGGLTSLPAIIINYIKRGEAEKGREGPLTLSHMRWQINTFWLTLLLALLCGVVSVFFAVSVLGVVLIYPLWVGLLVWFVYRLIKGMLALNSGREVN